MKSFLTLSFLLCLFSIRGLANPYGMAGCGVGALIFQDKPGKIQILAVTTNQYFNQSYSITTGTSNCFEDSGQSAENYIKANHVALRKDISRGTGEALAGLLNLMGCGDHQTVGTALQKNYGTIFNGSSESEVLINATIQGTIKNEPSLKLACRNIG